MTKLILDKIEQVISHMSHWLQHVVSASLWHINCLCLLVGPLDNTFHSQSDTPLGPQLLHSWFSHKANLGVSPDSTTLFTGGIKNMKVNRTNKSHFSQRHIRVYYYHGQQDIKKVSLGGSQYWYCTYALY